MVFLAPQYDGRKIDLSHSKYDFVENLLHEVARRTPRLSYRYGMSVRSLPTSYTFGLLPPSVRALFS